MKLSKIVLSSAAALALTLTVGNAPQANASTTENTDLTESTINDNYEVVPLIDWSGNAYLTRNTWSNVVGSNNIFRDTPTLTNRAGNPGAVYFRVMNGEGEIILTSGLCAVGSSVKLGPIPAFAGDYVIQANAQVTGTYNIAVD